MKYNDNYTIHLPEILHPKGDILSELGVIGRQEKGVHFIAMLFRRQMMTPNHSGFVNVMSKECKDLYSKAAYYAFKNMLIAKGLLEEYRSWLAGSKSIGMRLTAKAMEGPLASYDLKSKFKDRLAEKERRNAKERPPLPEPVKKMAETFEKIELPPNYKDILDRETNLNRKRQMEYSVLRHKARDFSIGGSNSGRFFHNYNGMAKDLRHGLTIEGKNLFEVDIKTCQPLLLSLMFNDAHMINVCREGDFYNVLSEWIHRQTGEIISREGIKKDVMVNILNPKKINGRAYWEGTTINNAFKESFPKAYDGLEKLRANEKLARLLPSKLQSEESKIIHGSVLPDLQSQRIEVFSVHDSAVVQKNYSETAETILRKHIDKMTTRK